MKREELEILKALIDDECERIEIEEKEAFLRGPHRKFNIGDWVTDGEIIGKVQALWPPAHINVDVKNGKGGVACMTKANDWLSVSKEVREYYTTEVDFVVSFTGEDVESMLMSYHRSINPSATKGKLLDALEAIRYNETNC